MSEPKFRQSQARFSGNKPATPLQKTRESTIHAASIRILKEDVRIMNAGVEKQNHLFSESSEEGWLKALFRYTLHAAKRNI